MAESRSRIWALIGAVLCCMALAACTSPPRNPIDPRALLHDDWFGAPAAPPGADSIFALSPAMQQFAAEHLVPGVGREDPRRALVRLLYAQRGLQLTYDTDRTRNAAEAFEARAGNCLSLVLMTAAFAKHLGMPVSYRAVQVDDYYSRNGDLTLASGHVNLVLESQVPRAAASRVGVGSDAAQDLLVDFLPASDLRGQRSEPLQEHTIAAMFMNNRAAESLAQGELRAAYAWAREALRRDPEFAGAANTLGVIYLRADRLQGAEQAFRRVLAREPQHKAALSNLVVALHRAGRSAEAQDAARQLAALQPYPPFHFLDRGKLALAEGDASRARALFQRELRLQPDHHEAHFWIAVAATRLGETQSAERHLRMAMENSQSQHLSARYAGKLAHLRATAAAGDTGVR